MYRGINFSTDNLKCVFCGIELENREQSFFNCPVIKNIWKEITIWTGKLKGEEDDYLLNFMDGYSFYSEKKSLK